VAPAAASRLDPSPGQPPPQGEGILRLLPEEFLHLVHEPLGAGVVFAFVPGTAGLEFPQQFFLAFGEVDWGFHHHMGMEIAGMVAAHALDALAAQSEYLAGLGFGGNFDGGVAVQGGNVDFATQGRRDERDGHLAMQIVVVPLEDLMGLEVDLDVEIAGRPAVDTGFALAGQTDAVTVVHTGGNPHGQGLVLLDAAFAVAMGAGVGDDPAAAVATRTSLLDGEETLLHAHLAMATAGRAGYRLGARLGAGTVAMLALGQDGNADLGFGAARGLFQADFQVVTEIGAPVDMGAAPAAAASAEHVAEDVREGVGEVTEIAGPAGAGHGRIHAGMAVLVVGRALIAVGQDFVGFLGFLEFFLRRLFTLVPVRMMLHGQLLEGLLDFVVGGGFRHAQNFVVIPLGHACFRVLKLTGFRPAPE
jgi:hypothetical protein